MAAEGGWRNIVKKLTNEKNNKDEHEMQRCNRYENDHTHFQKGKKRRKNILMDVVGFLISNIIRK